jgi:hypothetical protein
MTLTFRSLAMEYTILIYETSDDRPTRSSPDVALSYSAAFAAYTKTLVDAGVMVGGAGLQPPETATTIQLRDGKRHVQDGPYADTKEQLGGYFVIDVADLDAALAWAKRMPNVTYGSVEIRPLSSHEQDA